MKSFNPSIRQLNKNAPAMFIEGIISLFLLVVLVSGCTLIKLKKDVSKSLESAVIVGRIYGKFSGKGPIVVAACSKEERNNVAHFTVLHDSGEYELMVRQGAYYVFAFWDKNSNLTYDAGEPAGQYGDPTPVDVPAVGVVFDIDVAIPEKSEGIGLPLGFRIAKATRQNLKSRQAGAIVDLDDERFSQKNGIKGFWEPFTFYRELGGNVYFLEKYDPEKIPILFIHGACGTPKGWQYFVDHIDRTRYQPWFYYYPTGVRMDSMSYLLLWKLTNLYTKYQFREIYITAHSMGGLIARSFIVNYNHQFPFVTLFISLATPWGGDKMAEYGVQQSPAVIPSWFDMQPEGDFIKSLYRKKMPESVSFYMFSGYKGSRNPFRSNNDGTIILSSIMDSRAQSEAKMNYVFNEDHASIAYSEEVLSQYNAILDTFDETHGVAVQRSGGYIRVHFTGNDDFNRTTFKHVFILRPVDRKDVEETVIYLSNHDNGKAFGPFPVGKYLAFMLTSAGKSTQKYVPVSIENNKTENINFAFIPDGEIFGFLTNPVNPENKSPGRPGDLYLADNENISIQSITLTGNGIRRQLKPAQAEEDINNWDVLISRADFCLNGYFGFFGLPAGEYTLLIKARGRKPIEKKYSVTPGVPGTFQATELIPD